jgi:hypothetical protein
MNLTEHEAREIALVSWRAALKGAFRRRSLAQSTVAALTVGSILFMVNLYTQVREGPLTAILVVRVGLTFLVPWCNATLGIALGLRKSGLPRFTST